MAKDQGFMDGRESDDDRRHREDRLRYEERKRAIDENIAGQQALTEQYRGVLARCEMQVTNVRRLLALPENAGDVAYLARELRDAERAEETVKVLLVAQERKTEISALRYELADRTISPGRRTWIKARMGELGEPIDD